MEVNMPQMTISEDIRPISDLKAKGSEIVTHVTDTQRPVILTRHGRGVAVVLAVEEYERLQRASDDRALIAALREGERDFEDGRVVTHEEMRAKWLTEAP